MGDQTQTREEILKALDTVVDPETQTSARALVKGLQVAEDGTVLFMIEVDPARGPSMEPLRQQAENAVAKVQGVSRVTAVLTAEKQADKAPPQNDPHGMGKNPRLELPIKRIIAVASGKGGVGKSTMSANIARALAKSGVSVGLLDADIYGPSQPKLMGLEPHKPTLSEDKKIIPPEVGGIKVASIGFMVEAEKALVWRGPMVQSALYQLFRDVQWAEEGTELDVLIVDMPPGTGDAQLTLAQKVPVTGAIIVSTPQDLALADARKAIEMFNTVDVPVLGLIENMSTHVCSNCGHEEHIFGHGGAKAEAEKLNIPFLGEVPLSLDIRSRSDAGQGVDLPFDIAGILN